MTFTATVFQSRSAGMRSRRQLMSLLTVAALSVWGGFLPRLAHAATVEEAVVDLQHEWEIIKYQTAGSEREKRYEALADKAHKVSETHAGRAEPLAWEGIIVASWAGEKGGLGALGLAKKAKAIYDSSSAIDGNALDGSAYNSLGVLYYKVPGWPIGFGDKDKARELIQKALALNPKGIDPNFFYGEFLIETKHPDEAVTYLERAQQAPARPGRQISDVGRREEIRVLLEKIKSR
ncbi:MAG: tetratricopeptide repeat protein [Rhizobacter sp.]